MDRIERADAAIARQLSASLQREGRMINRLLKLKDHPATSGGVRMAIEKIIKDEDPPRID